MGQECINLTYDDNLDALNALRMYKAHKAREKFQSHFRFGSNVYVATTQGGSTYDDPEYVSIQLWNPEFVELPVINDPNLANDVLQTILHEFRERGIIPDREDYLAVAAFEDIVEVLGRIIP